MYFFTLRGLHCRSHIVDVDSVFSISSSSGVFKKINRNQCLQQSNKQVFLNRSDGDQTAYNHECTQGRKKTPMIETTGTICLYLGIALFPCLPLPFLLLSSSNGFQLSYCSCIILPDSVNRFQYNKKEKQKIPPPLLFMKLFSNQN